MSYEERKDYYRQRYQKYKDNYREYHKKHSREKRDKGLCSYCDKPAEPGKLRCKGHLETRRQVRNATRTERAGQKICTLCGIREVAGKYRRCESCRSKTRTSASLQRARKILSGQCGKCATPVTVAAFCETCTFKKCASRYLGTMKKWTDLRDLFVRQNALCPYSGRKLTLGLDAELDHIIPRTKGGPSTIDNLQWVNADVNRMKRNLLPGEFLDLVDEIYLRRHS